MIERLYSVTETAKILGVSKRTIFNYLSETGEKRLPASKVGRLWKIRESDLEKFISRKTNKER